MAKKQSCNMFEVFEKIVVANFVMREIFRFNLALCIGLAANLVFAASSFAQVLQNQATGTGWTPRQANDGALYELNKWMMQVCPQGIGNRSFYTVSSGRQNITGLWGTTLRVTCTCWKPAPPVIHNDRPIVNDGHGIRIGPPQHFDPPHQAPYFPNIPAVNPGVRWQPVPPVVPNSNEIEWTYPTNVQPDFQQFRGPAQYSYTPLIPSAPFGTPFSSPLNTGLYENTSNLTPPPYEESVLERTIMQTNARAANATNRDMLYRFDMYSDGTPMVRINTVPIGHGSTVVKAFDDPQDYLKPGAPQGYVKVSSTFVFYPMFGPAQVYTQEQMNTAINRAKP